MEGNKLEQEAVLATDHWANELRAMPFYAKVSTFIDNVLIIREKDE